VKYVHFARGLLVITAGTVHAGSDISSKFDGRYAGTAEAASGIGARGCSSFTLGDVVIAQGFLRAARTDNQPSVSGFITEEGYVAASMSRPGHMRSAMDGRLVEGVIVAGFIEADTNCAWVVRLLPYPPS
jgi:hypothetical protein